MIPLNYPELAVNGSRFFQVEQKDEPLIRVEPRPRVENEKLKSREDGTPNCFMYDVHTELAEGRVWSSWL